MRNDTARAIGLSLLFGIISACSSFPTPEYKTYRFPEDRAFYGNHKRPYLTMGQVRTKVNYQSLDPSHEEAELCQNYFNKAVVEMVKMAKQRGADAIIDVKSVVFYEGGQFESFPRPECSDDGMEGQVLTQAIAIKWKTAQVTTQKNDQNKNSQHYPGVK